MKLVSSVSICVSIALASSKRKELNTLVNKECESLRIFCDYIHQCFSSDYCWHYWLSSQQRRYIHL